MSYHPTGVVVVDNTAIVKQIATQPTRPPPPPPPKTIRRALGACCAACVMGDDAPKVAYVPKPSVTVTPLRPATPAPTVAPVPSGSSLVVKLALVAGIGVGGFFLYRKLHKRR